MVLAALAGQKLKRYYVKIILECLEFVWCCCLLDAVLVGKTLCASQQVKLLANCLHVEFLKLLVGATACRQSLSGDHFAQSIFEVDVVQPSCCSHLLDGMTALGCWLLGAMMNCLSLLFLFRKESRPCTWMAYWICFALLELTSVSGGRCNFRRGF